MNLYVHLKLQIIDWTPLFRECSLISCLFSSSLSIILEAFPGHLGNFAQLIAINQNISELFPLKKIMEI